MLLVFTQKMGGSLLLHNLLHTSSSAPSKQNDNTKEINYACSCIDDFLVPFVEADEPVVSPVITQSIVVNTFLHESISFPSHNFISQRGPPAGIL